MCAAARLDPPLNSIAPRDGDKRGRETPVKLSEAALLVDSTAQACGGTVRVGRKGPRKEIAF